MHAYDFNYTIQMNVKAPDSLVRYYVHCYCVGHVYYITPIAQLSKSFSVK